MIDQVDRRDAWDATSAGRHSPPDCLFDACPEAAGHGAEMVAWFCSRGTLPFSGCVKALLNYTRRDVKKKARSYPESI